MGRDFQQPSRPALGPTQPCCTLSSGSFEGINSLWMSVWMLNHHKMPKEFTCAIFWKKKVTFSLDILRIALLFSSRVLWFSRLIVLTVNYFAILAVSKQTPEDWYRVPLAHFPVRSAPSPSNAHVAFKHLRTAISNWARDCAVWPF